MLGFLTRPEIEAVPAAPDSDTWSGRRDRVLLTTMYNTGARVSEIIDMRRRDVVIEGSPSVLLHGKGRKERGVPLWRRTARSLRQWLTRLGLSDEQYVFPNRAGVRMSRSGVERRLGAAVTTAARACPSLRGRSISPHTLRHTTAMHLLQSGVDVTVVALWLGHESPATTHQYVEADVEMKRAALAALRPAGAAREHYRPADGLLAFLEDLTRPTRSAEDGP